MDVRCPQCDTLYEIDEHQLRGGAATLKCSQCDHVFRLQSQAALSRENQRRWMVKNTSTGDILYFSEFDQLHQWILQGKVTKTDQVSRTGKTWQRLEAIGEFRPIFQAVESISSISASHAAAQKDQSQQQQGQKDLQEESKPAPAAESSAPSSAPQARPDSPRPSKPAPSHSAPNPSAPNPSGTSPAATRQPATGQPRPKVKTSQQFGIQKPPSRAPSTKEASPSPPGAPRQGNDQKGGQNGGQPNAGQPNAGQPNAGQSSGSGPKVRLQTGAFGAPSNASSTPDDEQWSFGDGSTLGEAELEDTERTGRFEKVDYEGGGRRWSVIMVVALLLVAAGGAGVYFLRPDLLEQYLPQQAKQDVVDIDHAGEEEAQDDAPEPAEASPDELVKAAVRRAVVSATEANAAHLGAAADAARPQVFAGIADASEAATKAAEEPDPDEILQSAQRSLERGDAARARQKFHEVIEIERNNAEAITGLGWSLLALGNAGSASAQFQKALNYNRSYGDAYIGLGKAEREQGNHQAALKAYQDYLSRFPAGKKASIARYQADKLKATLGQ